MEEHTITELHAMQGLPLNDKIEMSRERIKAWVDYWGLENVAISFSGGKDSTVLLDIARKDYPEIEAVFCDTGLEFPEIREFVNTFDNVTILKPKMTFTEVIKRNGYPMISKEVSETVQGARRYLKSLIERTEQATTGKEKTPYHYWYDRLTGQGKYSKKDADEAALARNSGGDTTESIEKSEELANLMSIEKGSHAGQVYRAARLLGMLTVDNQIKVNIPKKDYSAFSCEKYKFFLDAPFEISNRCCGVMKKQPSKKYNKKMITAQMASESRLRTQVWLKNGCNAFDSQKPISNPFSFWTEQDVLLYVREHNLPIASVYGNVVSDDEDSGQYNLADLGLFDIGNCELHTTGCARTGCVFCGFGFFMEKRPNRFEMIDKVSNPAIRDFCFRGGAFDKDGLWKPDNRGLGYWFVLLWIKTAGNFDSYIPDIDRYVSEYGNERTTIELEKAKQIGLQSRKERVK